VGIDVYVGTLTRYHAGRWKTVVQQSAEAQGIQFERHDAAGRLVDAPPLDPAEVRPIVEKWRRDISTGLGKRLKTPLDWDESDERPYFTDKPGWWGYQGVLLLAAHRELATFGWSLPKKMPEDLNADPAVTAGSGMKRYGQLFEAAVWLPAKLDFTFRAHWITGDDLTFGSNVVLLDQLRDLNRRTYKADVATLAEWRKGEGPDDLADWPAELMAKYGLAVFTGLAERSVESRLPMLLDF
jgi:hypothetical protein